MAGILIVLFIFTAYWFWHYSRRLENLQPRGVSELHTVLIGRLLLNEEMPRQIVQRAKHNIDQEVKGFSSMLDNMTDEQIWREFRD